MALQKPRFGGAQNMEVRNKEKETRLTSTTHILLEPCYNKEGAEMEKRTGDVEKFLASRNTSFVEGNDKKIETAPSLYDSTSDISLSPRTTEGSPTSWNVSQTSDLQVEGVEAYHLEELLRVFYELEIKASPKPYTRLTCQLNLHDDNGLPAGATSASQALVKGTSTAEGDVSLKDLYQDILSCGDDVVYCKNLFLKDRKGQFYIIILPESGAADLKKLKQQLNANRNLSFADENALTTILQLKPGSVTPLAIMHDSAKDVRVAIDRSLVTKCTANIKLAFHPLIFSQQVELTFPELKCFCERFARKLEILVDEAEGAHDSECNASRSTVRKQKTHKVSKVKGEKPVSKISRGGSERLNTNNDNICSIRSDQKQGKSRENVSTMGGQGKTRLSENLCFSSDTDGDVSQTKNLDGERSIQATMLKRKSKADIPPATFHHSHDELKHEKLITVADVKPDDEEAMYLDTDHSDERTGQGYSPETEKIISSQAQSEPLTVDNCKVRFKWFDRKGKLKSYLRKSCREPKEKTESGNAPSDNKKDLNDETQGVRCSDDESGSTQHATVSSTSETSAFHIKSEELGKSGACKAVRLMNIKQEQLLPEVQQFYQSFEDFNISYKEVDLSLADSKSLGPSVGCRSFLLKDKGNNYYFVVTHEFYELDYGRLKKALRPKRKVVIAAPEEIMAELRVDPTRLTPFAYTTGNVDDIRIFFTNKIRPASLVLSIQSPFSQGHRIIMTSSELQRYLRLHGAEIEHVEEKHWPTRYNTIFSQFERTVEAELQICRGKDLHQHESPARSHSETTNDLDENYSEAQSLVSNDRSKLSKSSYEKLFDILYSFTPTPMRAMIPGLSYVNMTNICESSVDPLQLGVESVATLDNQNASRERTTAKPDSHMKHSPKDGVHLLQTSRTCSISVKTPDNNIENCSVPTSLNMNNLTVEDIVKHLSEHDVKFHLKQSQMTKNSERFFDDSLKEACQETGNQKDTKAVERTLHNELRTETRHENDDPFFEILKTDSQDILGEADLDNMNEFDTLIDREETSDDDDDFVEKCSIVQLDDQEDTTYVIVGGELDFISTKRFCRRFHIGKKLKISYSSFETKSQSSGLRHTPFSIFMMNKGMTARKLQFVLTTSIYIEPETLLKFSLNSEGSSLTMTSKEFENYAKKVGCEVWYMP